VKDSCIDRVLVYSLLGMSLLVGGWLWWKLMQLAVP
jgi:hypothetical protein